VVYQFELSRSYTNLARLGRELGRLDDARRAYRMAIALAEPLDAEDPKLREFRGDLAWTFNQLGITLLEANPPAANEALEALERGRELYNRLRRKHPGVPDYRSGRGQSLLEIGIAHQALGQPTEARRYCREARAAYEQLVSENNGVTEYLSGLAQSRDALGRLETQAGDLDAARQSCLRARTILEQLLKEDPGNLQYRSDLGQVLSDLARAELALGHKPQATELYQQAIAAHRAAVAKAPQVALYQRRLEADLSALAAIAPEPHKPDSPPPSRAQ
jgi:tetratricopeptide (TPR) repeat protein